MSAMRPPAPISKVKALADNLLGLFPFEAITASYGDVGGLIETSRYGSIPKGRIIECLELGYG